MKRHQTTAMVEVMNNNTKCELCGSPRDLQAHHIIPVICGGPDTIENILCVCRKCHVLLTPTSLLTKIALSKSEAQLGQPKGAKLITKKSIRCKEIIRKQSKDFGGTLSDSEVMKLTGLARGTYYKYKRELKAE